MDRTISQSQSELLRDILDLITSGSGKVASSTQDTSIVAGQRIPFKMSIAQQLITKANSSSVFDYDAIGTITNSTTAVVFKGAAGVSLRNFVTSITLNTDTLGTATELAIRLSVGLLAANTLTTATAHDFQIGDQLVFTAIGSGLTGIPTVGTICYVKTVPSTTTFTISAVPNGAETTITGTLAGTATLNRILFRTKMQTTALPITQLEFTQPLKSAPNTALEIVGLTASTGGIYYNITGFVAFN